MSLLSNCWQTLLFAVSSLADIVLIIAIDVFHLDVHEGYQTCLGLASAIMRYYPSHVTNNQFQQIMGENKRYIQIPVININTYGVPTIQFPVHVPHYVEPVSISRPPHQLSHPQSETYLIILTVYFYSVFLVSVVLFQNVFLP